MDLLERIDALCKRDGVSRRRFEQEIGLSNGAVSKWAESFPIGDIVRKSAVYFGVTTDYLLGREVEFVDSWRDDWREDFAGATSKGQKRIILMEHGVTDDLKPCAQDLFDVPEINETISYSQEEKGLIWLYRTANKRARDVAMGALMAGQAASVSDDIRAQILGRLFPGVAVSAPSSHTD